ncbi:MAG: aminotransferase class V-fold PLP-dependent enzyme [Planctomycetota bacterium]
MIYLDHAATSFPKPPEVLAAVSHWYTAVGVSPSRGDSALCRAASTIVERARAGVARLCGVARERVLFSSGATESANLFLHGFLRDGDAVVATAAEHSALARPLRALANQGRIDLFVVPVDPLGRVDEESLAATLGARKPRLLALNHASNVTGAVQDATRWCAAARAVGCTTLVDASQTAGVLPLTAVGADALVASAHKSLLGPPGVGFLALAPDVPLRPVKLGGTGSSKALDLQPDSWPEAHEAGTPNMPGLAGLAAALDWLDAQAPGHHHAHALELIDDLRARLEARLGDAVRWCSPSEGPRLGVLSFTLADLDPAEAGIVLDAADVHVRTGFHCAPWIHAYLDTASTGTIRVSPGPFVTEVDIRQVAKVLAP